MSEFYGPADDAAAIAVLHRALALGVNFFDSSDMYGPYTNEKLLGKAFAGTRQQAIIATKFGSCAMRLAVGMASTGVPNTCGQVAKRA